MTKSHAKHSKSANPKGSLPKVPSAPPKPQVEVTFIFQDSLGHSIAGLQIRIAAGSGATPSPVWVLGSSAPAGPSSTPVASQSEPAGAPLITPLTTTNSTEATTDANGFAVTISNAARNQPIDIFVKKKSGKFSPKGTVVPSKDVNLYTVASPEYHFDSVTKLAPKDGLEQDLPIPTVAPNEVMTVDRLLNEFGPYIWSVEVITEEGSVIKDFPKQIKTSRTDPDTGKKTTDITIEHHYKAIKTGSPRTIPLSLLPSRLNYPNPVKISEQTFSDVAKSLNCEIAAVKAITYTESSGAPFIKNGLPQLRFERHYFYRLSLPADKQKTYTKQPNPYPTVPDLCSKKQGGYSVGRPSGDNVYPGMPHADQDTLYEYERLIRAARINRDVALMSCSWGAFQVMGEFFKECGFASITDFVNESMKSVDAQVKIFVNYVQFVSPAALTALRNKDWVRFSKAYNGPGAKPEYAKTMQENYEKYK